MSKTIYCEECAPCEPGCEDNEDEYGPAPADYRVKGYKMDPATGGRERFSGYVCADHLLLLEEDGGEFTVIETL